MYVYAYIAHSYVGTHARGYTGAYAAGLLARTSATRVHRPVVGPDRSYYRPINTRSMARCPRMTQLRLGYSAMQDRQTDRQTGRQTDRQTGRQADRQTDRQTDRGRQTDRQTDRRAAR